MSREGEIGRRQANDFINQLESEGVRTDHIQRAQDNKKLRKAVAELLIIPDMFISPDKQLDLVRRRNAGHGWGFTEEHFVALGKSPAWPSGLLSAVVLDVGLDSIEQTFEEAWSCIVESQRDRDRSESPWRWHGVKSDREHLRLHGRRSHERGLKWRVVDFAAHWDKKNGIRPQDVRDINSPDSACLWAASYFPNYIQAMDGENIPYMWIPGYELCVDGHAPWTHVPSLFWFRVSRWVELYADFADHCGRRWAVPSFREC